MFGLNILGGLFSSKGSYQTEIKLGENEDFEIGLRKFRKQVCVCQR